MAFGPFLLLALMEGLVTAGRRGPMWPGTIPRGPPDR